MDKEGDFSKQGTHLNALISFPLVLSELALSDETKTVGYDFEQIVRISVFFLSDQQKYSRDSKARANLTEATILVHENNLKKS